MSVMLNRPLVPPPAAPDAPRDRPAAPACVTVSWVPLGTLWGEVKPSTGREVDGEEVRIASVGFRITVRGAAMGSPQRPRPEQRLRDESRVFVILAVTERDLSGAFLTCFAAEEQPA